MASPGVGRGPCRRRPCALVEQLDTLKVRRNETSLIAAPLAARLGLERLWSVDDHSADSDDSVDQQAYAAAMTRA